MHNKIFSHPLNNPLLYNLWQKPFVLQKIAPFLEDNCLVESQRVLELGCGPGTNVKIFCNNNYTGIDIDKSYIGQAKELHPNANFIVSDASTADKQLSSKFDLIFSNSLLHHLDDDQIQGLFASSKKLLAAGGKICIIDMVSETHSKLCKTLVQLDRGKYPRTENVLRELFGTYFNERKFVRFNLKLFGATFWEMIYLRGAI